MISELKNIMLWDFFDKPNIYRLWHLLLFSAEEKDCVKNGVPLKRGQLITSYNDLAKRLGVSVKVIRTSLQALCPGHIKGTPWAHQGTIITICNYDSYDNFGHAEGTPRACQGHAKEQENKEEDNRKEINENERFLPPDPLSSKEKENKEKKTEEGTKEKEDALYYTLNAGEAIEQKPKTKRFVPPTLEEVKAYVEEKDYKFDPEMFYNFYTAKGWMIGKNPVKNWKACCGTWSRRDSDTNQTIITNSNARQENEELLSRYDASDKGYGGFIHYIADNAPNVTQNVKLPSQEEYITITAQHRQYFAAALQLMNGYSKLSTTTFFSVFIKAIQEIKKTIDYGTLQQQNRQFADRVFAEDMCRIIERDARIARETPDVPL